MKIAAMTIVYNEAQLVEGCIKSFKPFVDKHLFMVASLPFNARDKFKTQDNTLEKILEFGGVFEVGAWSKEHVMRNDGLSLLSEYDWIITPDVDMWFEHRMVEQMLSRIGDAKVYKVQQLAYWKDTNHILLGDDFCPVSLVKQGTEYVHIGDVNCPAQVMDGVYCHHINWCQPKDIYKKVMTYAHAPEFDGSQWYKQYYLGWKPGMDAVLPNKRFKVSFSPLPRELQEYLPKGGV